MIFTSPKRLPTTVWKHKSGIVYTNEIILVIRQLEKFWLPYFFKKFFVRYIQNDNVFLRKNGLFLCIFPAKYQDNTKKNNKNKY